MGYRPHGRARVNPSGPQAFAICDRCGALWNRVDLQAQTLWGGPRLFNTGWLVCRRCLDVPNEQLRSLVLPPDPPPILQPRVETFFIDETNFIVTEEGVYLGDEAGAIFITEGEGSAWGNL